MSSQKLLFVYGSLKEGFGNHGVIHVGEAELLGKDRIEGWDMYSFGGFPAIDRGDKWVIGEVYKVDETTWKAVETLEGYPRFYNRATVHTKYGDASVYYVPNVASRGLPPVPLGIWQEEAHYHTPHTAYAG